MSPHVKRFDDVRDLIAHLEHIDYLYRGSDGDLVGTPGVTMTAIDYPAHDGCAYILNHTTPSGQRSHRVDFPQVVGAVTFEHELNAAGVPYVGM